jgi:hypothetical protein
LRIYHGQVLVLRPARYKGRFIWKSINKINPETVARTLRQKGRP